MWSVSHGRRRVGRSVALLSAALCVAALTTGIRLQAQGLITVIVMKSGLHTFAPDHMVRATVSELGAGLAAKVRIELRSRKNELVASTDGELKAGSPVHIDFTNPSSELAQLSVAVTILTRTPLTTAPAAVVEDIGPDQLTIEPRTQCSGPPSGRDSAQTISLCGCPGWSVKSFVAGV